MRKRRLTIPKAPIIHTGAHRYFFPLLVQLGNEILEKKFKAEDFGEIRIYYDGIIWHFEIFGNPDLY